MLSSRANFPDLETLTKNVNYVFDINQFSYDQVTIQSREPNDYATTFPSEIITCQFPDGSNLRLICKYAAGFNHNSHGHRGGVSYEAKIYRHILQKLQASTPTFYGAGKEKITGESWIILEYFDEELRVKASNSFSAMQAAARWLGNFHRENESLLSKTSLPFLNQHDVDYYLGWSDRTSQFADHLHKRYPWLEKVCERFNEVVYILLEKQENIIHGEYYPNNVLFYQKNIYPVDWESAAIAIGEIDLASLIEKWPQHVSKNCTQIYKSTRWPEGQPDDFDLKLDTAQLYWNFRWLGDRPEWTHNPEGVKRIERLQFLAEQMGLI
jgi:hypothetical protein